MTGQEQIISSPSHILGLLRRLQATHALVSIQYGKDTHFYTTVILAIQPDENCFLIDAPDIAAWHTQLQAGANLQLLGRLAGVRIQCQVALLESLAAEDKAVYRVMLPRQLLYKQRRRHFRAQINDDKSLAIHLPLSIKQNIQGYVVDISASGVCTRIDFSDASSLTMEQAIRHARIALPDKQMLTCDLMLRSVRHYPEKGFSLIGGEFQHIPPHQQHHIERLVAALDRDQRRRNDIAN
jgi:c-di-GMP-binding flagellar brake protein YcgR